MKVVLSHSARLILIAFLSEPKIIVFMERGRGSAANLQIVLYSRVFHKNTFSKKLIVHTPTTPYRAYINHMQCVRKRNLASRT